MKYLRFLFVALVIGLASCSQPTTPTSTVSPTIENIGWTIGNIPSDFWSNGSGPSAVINLGVYFEDAKLKLSDLKKVTIRNSLAPEYEWSHAASDLEEKFYTSTSTKKGALSFPNLWSPNIASNGSVIYLGSYTIEVELENGKTASKTLATPAPNSLNTNIYNYTYSPEDYISTPPSDYVALPKRATIQSAIANAVNGTLNIEFSVDDDKVYSGWVWLYNKDREVIGYIETIFREFSTGVIHPRLNNGTVFNNDGTTNILALRLTDITKTDVVTNVNLADVVSLRITLTDGKQYEGTDSTYDTYSYSFSNVSQE